MQLPHSYNVPDTAVEVHRRSLSKVFFLFSLLLVYGSTSKFQAYRDVDRYDDIFKKYSAEQFGPEFDWRYFKAQAIAESRLRKKAQSHDGAMGIMQILPDTFRDIVDKNPAIEDKPWHPRWNIAAAIHYDRMLWDAWQANRSRRDRMRFMFGSYNAGLGSILEAQEAALKRNLNPYRWRTIEQTLPEVLGTASSETIEYVRDIFKIRQALGRPCPACANRNEG